jgi:hypothetical protein
MDRSPIRHDAVYVKMNKKSMLDQYVVDDTGSGMAEADGRLGLRLTKRRSCR